MTHLSVTDIEYQTDSATLFEAVMDLPHATWLDSGRPLSLYGRYDIISAAPSCVLTTHGNNTRVSGSQNFESTDDPFDLVSEQLKPLATHSAKDLPFCGGALGYFGYDLSRRLEKLPEHSQADISLPDMQIGIYDWALIQDHQQEHAWLICLPSCPASQRLDLQARCRKLRSSPKKEKENNPFSINRFEGDIDLDSYINGIDKIQRYISAGDCYQVNFSQRFSADYQGDPYSAYLKLRKALPSPFSGYMTSEQGAILSFSPERFLHLAGRQVETKPIKGTMPRSSDPDIDQRNADTLRHSPKDRAENLMIVDLLRNDLSKSCELGSVRVPELFSLTSFPNVHHLISTVNGTLNSDKTPLDLLRDCFPGGSITGAPKLRAMEIIDELEATRRSAYCGSLGYISANGNMDTSIAVRTLVCDQQQIHCWGGGGITADSDPQAEYQESLDKINILLKTLSDDM